jgi:FixJ family two-component response regulator
MPADAKRPADAPTTALPLTLVALDDDADFREYLRGMLSSEGHDVRVVATPDELYLAVESRMPDAVLLDMKMGRHSGETVLTELRKRWAKLCVIVLTGYPSLETMRSTFKQDVFDYLAKPFSLEDLRNTLQQAARAFDLGRRPQDRLRQELGRQIKLARVEKGWTLKDLSDVSGVSVSQLSSIERGAHLPSLESLIMVAAAIQRPASDWLRAAGF